MGDDDTRRARAAAQWLDRRRRASPHAVVRHLGGVQAQVPAAAAMAIHARATTTEDAVRSAVVDDRSVVRCWAMRGTLHLIAAEDHPRFVAMLCEPHIPRSMRRLGQEGVGADDAARAVGSIHRMLAADGPMTRAEIAGRLARRGIRTEGQAVAHLVWLAASDGTICAGPDRDAERTFVLARDWLPAAAATRVRDAREAALTDLAVRYLGAHAPAGPEDFATWSGLPLAAARRAIAAVAERFAGPQPERPRRPRTGRPADRHPLPPRLLPAFDEYLLGWRDRTASVEPRHAVRVNAGGGWIRPTVVDDGRVVATWTIERTPRSVAAAEVVLQAFGPDGDGLAVRLRDEVRALGRFLGRTLAIRTSE